MTLATDIAKLGTYEGTTDIPNAVEQGLDLISIYFGSTYTQGTDADWDRIAKVQIIHLLDRMTLQRRALTDSTISVPPLISKDIHEMIKALQTEEIDDKATFAIGINNDTDTYGFFHEDAE